jgi:hypothetical protein
MSETYCYCGTFKHCVEADSDEEADEIFINDMKNIYDYEVEEMEIY